MRNEAISGRLREIADILEMEEVEYKPRAYRKAARRIESLNEDVEDIHERGELADIEGVGESIKSKIVEFLETGEMGYYQELKAEYPVDIETLETVEGIGPKSVKKLYEELGIEDLDDLESAAQADEIAGIEGFGEQTQRNILGHVDMAKRAAERTLLGRAFDRAREIRDRLADAEPFDRVRLVGSFRRRRPTIGDVDVLATAPDAEAAMETFCTQEIVAEVLARGQTKSSVILPGDLQVDLRIVDDAGYGAATVYFTGSADHNVALRERALDRGWKLNEYGLFDVSETQSEARQAGERLAGKTEREVYEALELAYPPPELRENTGEVAAAATDDLPDLVTLEDVRGDLHAHTTASDGAASVREMAERAAEKGHEYVCITDHGPTLDVADGLDDDSFDRQAETVADIDDDLDITVLHGIEADVTGDGLAIPDEWVEAVDLLLVAMHEQPKHPTERLCSVLESYPVDVVAHPQNRRIREREPNELDLARVSEVAVAENTALEINAQPERLDLDWHAVKEYRDEATYVVSTDAHDTSEFDYLHLGVAQARRGWCEPADLLNTRPSDDVTSWLGRK